MDTVEAGGITLAHRTWGPETAPPVVLLHARGLDGADWTRVAERLAAGPRRVYAPDLRGHGHSDWPGEYGYEAMRDDVHAYLTTLGLTRPDVIGHSLGGIVACLLAQEHPGHVRRLVLEDVPVTIPLDPPRPPAERPPGELPYDWAMITATDAQRNAPDPAWRAGAVRITAPTLLIGGGPGSPIPQEQVAELAGLLPDVRHVTVDAGHLVHANRPQEFLVHVEGFLS
ncbi:alpha/beta hydrolase [Streptomyces sp. NPDC004539]|uniref:alpha/beta fold hydrolase n=1 Tax=Streptomyces sp. NPDC004539 TaxID=3154280 RepID=UPI0033B1E1DE